jgi:hypothetical protein
MCSEVLEGKIGRGMESGMKMIGTSSKFMRLLAESDKLAVSSSKRQSGADALRLHYIHLGAYYRFC